MSSLVFAIAVPVIRARRAPRKLLLWSATRMAKKSRQAGVPDARRDVSPGPPSTPLGRARWLLEVGDVRRARSLAEEAVKSGPEAERAEARALLDRLRPDRASILTVAIVLLLILFAAWAAILRVR
jgi:FimV-like protein